MVCGKPAATLTPPEVDGFNAPNIAELNQPLNRNDDSAGQRY
ncbi:MAG: hypothetical protein ACLR5N_02270 [Haemophilus parainfluenzae]